MQITHGFDDEGRKFDRSGRLAPWWSNATTAAFANASTCLVAQYSAFNLTRQTSSPGEYIRGFLTLGENIADQGGVTLSWVAMLSKLAEERKQAMAIGAHSNGDNGGEDDYVSAALADMQRMEPRLRTINERKLFFLGYAQCECLSRRTALASVPKCACPPSPRLMLTLLPVLLFPCVCSAWCRVMRDEAFLRVLQYDPHSPSEARVNVPLANFKPFRDTFQCPPRVDEAAAQACIVW